MRRLVDMEFAYDRPAPSRSEMNCKVCISFIASVAISTFACTLVVLHLRIQPTVSPTKEPAAYQMLQEEPTQNTQSKPRNKPHAHLAIDHKSPSNNNGILGWRNISNNMEYKDSERSLVIPETGFYIIYLQVSYRWMDKSQCINGAMFLKHNVIKRQPSYSTTNGIDIISSLESVSCVEQGFKTIHNMARISLQKDDRLQVKVDSYRLVDAYGNSAAKTFWGVYLDLD